MVSENCINVSQTLSTSNALMHTAMQCWTLTWNCSADLQYHYRYSLYWQCMSLSNSGWTWVERGVVRISHDSTHFRFKQLLSRWQTAGQQRQQKCCLAFGVSLQYSLKRLQNEFHLNIIITTLSYHEHSFLAIPASLLSKKKEKQQR